MLLSIETFYRGFWALVLVGALGTSLLGCTDGQRIQEDTEPTVSRPIDVPETPHEMLPRSLSERNVDMTLERLDHLLREVDDDAERSEGTWKITFGTVLMMVVTDEGADRLRIMAPIAEANVLNPALMMRMLQANYDSALDARYAVARGLVWSTFIHPLASLDDMAVISAIYQVATAAESFGTTFSSGVFQYGGGDSENENRKRLKEIQERIRPTT